MSQIGSTYPPAPIIAQLALSIVNSEKSATVELEKAVAVRLLSLLSDATTIVVHETSLPQRNSSKDVADESNRTTPERSLLAIPEDREAFKVEEAAEILGLGLYTMRRYLRERRVLGEKSCDGRWRITRGELIRYWEHGPSQEYDPL